MSHAEDEMPEVPAAYDWEAFRQQGYKTIDFIVEHFKRVNARKLPVQARVTPGYLSRAFSKLSVPENPAPWSEILGEINDVIVPGLTLWQHPDFFAFFPAMVSPPAILGDMVANAFNNPGFNWVSCPAATELEMFVMNWLVDAFGLSAEFKWSGTGGGVLQPSATEAMIVVILAARSETLARHKHDPAAASKLVAYYSDQSHFCVEKALKVLAIPHSRKLDTHSADTPFKGNHPISAEDFQQQLILDIAAGLIPFFLSANFGATGICAIDPIESLAPIANENHVWLNVDAAYAGAVALCPEFRNLTSPFNLADSLLINGSKWFATMFNSNFMFFKRKSPVVCSLNASGVYLDNSHTSAGAVVDFKDYHLGLGRPFRSLKVYTTLRSFGLSGIRNILRRHIILSRYLEKRIASHDELHLPVQGLMGLVCFTLKHPRTNDDCLKLLEKLNATEKAFLVHTLLDGQVILRVSMAHPQLQKKDMDSLYQLIVEAITEL